MKTKVLAIFSIIIAAAVLLWGTNTIFAAPGIKENQNETAVTAYARSGFSYQGYLTDNSSNPLDGTYNMTFRFWDQETMGSQVGGDILINNVDVDQGLFTVIIDVPDGFFDGSALWLQTRVGTEWLDPLKEVLPVPYALSLWPGAETRGESPQGSAIFTAINLGDGHGLTGKTESTVENFMSAGVFGYSVYSRTFGVLGVSDYGIGVEGRVSNPDNTSAAVFGYNLGSGIGVGAISSVTHGIKGETLAAGSYENAGVYGYSTYSRTFGVLGESEFGIGVEGRNNNPDNWQAAMFGYNMGGGIGVGGISSVTHGIEGETLAAGSYENAGVYGYSTYSRTFGVLGESEFGIGVEGRNNNPDNWHAAMFGYNTGGGIGVGGISSVTHGIEGDTLAAGYYENAGVYGYSTYSRTFGVLGESEFGIGIEGRLTNTENTNGAVVGYNTGGGNGVEGYSTNNYGVYAEGGLYGVATPDGMLAPSFDVGSPDLAEFFPATGPEVTAGTVVVIDVGADGSFVLKLSTQPYDTAAAGIISTEPGITLGIKDGIIIPGENDGEVPLALVGRVPCQVDASYGAIQVGDLLTTSGTPGHAMVCNDLVACIGSIIGKALEPWDEGTGTILVLVTLQ